MEKIVTLHEMLGVDKSMDYRDLALRLYLQVNDLAEELAAHGFRPKDYCRQVPASDCSDCRHKGRVGWCWIVSTGKTAEEFMKAEA